MKKKYLFIITFLICLFANVIVCEATNDKFYYDGLPKEVSMPQSDAVEENKEYDDTATFTLAETNVLRSLATVLRVLLLVAYIISTIIRVLKNIVKNKISKEFMTENKEKIIITILFGISIIIINSIRIFSEPITLLITYLVSILLLGLIACVMAKEDKKGMFISVLKEGCQYLLYAALLLVMILLGFGIIERV